MIRQRTVDGVKEEWVATLDYIGDTYGQLSRVLLAEALRDADLAALYACSDSIYEAGDAGYARDLITALECDWQTLFGRRPY